MRVSSLSLEQFRSYSSLQLQFGDGGLEIFIGPNGSGKTNILESLCTLSRAKSCLGADTEDMIRWESDFYRVRADICHDAGETGAVEIVSQVRPRKQKACFVNDVRVPAIRFIGTLPSIVFLPSDLDLFTGSPARRREFLDGLLSQLSPEFIRVRIEYERVLKQRNALLRLIADDKGKEQDLTPWDSQIAMLGARIQQERIGLTDAMNGMIPPTLIFLGEQWSDIALRYDARKVTAQPTREESLLQLLKHYRHRDIILRSTTVGPHRDDWHLAADGRNIALFASRGQQRASLLALLFVSLTLFEQRRGEKPVILLDDVFSELDDNHQRHLLSAVQGSQVFLTSTHLPSKIPDYANVWNVNDGKVSSAR